jgi:uracil-DNA glycosylase
VHNVTDRQSNPFGFKPECDQLVPGFGDPNADFHLVGDHPGVHGGADTGYPFTGTEASERLQTALVAAGLLEKRGVPPTVDGTYLSYLYPCVTEHTPTEGNYSRLEPTFDAEVRAITAHVVVPVGERATEHVLSVLTAKKPAEFDLAAEHATEVSGGGWLVVPTLSPADWTADDKRALIERLRAIKERDYRRRADLGRFLPGGGAYLVR